jgi:Fur family ferric uptake transcriptional regulator
MSSVNATESHLDRDSVGSLLMRRLAAEGVRMTAQRKTLIEIIDESSEHLDAATLLRLARARDPHIHRATVYRTLELLKRMQIVDELDLMHLEGEKHFYEARSKSEHFHLACFNCGRIAEHDSPTFKALKREISEQIGFEIKVVRLEVGGRCHECQKQSLGSLQQPPSPKGKPRVRVDR